MPVTVNFKLSTYLFTANICHLPTPTDPFRQSSILSYLCGRQDVVIWVWILKRNVSYYDILVQNELNKNVEHLTVQLGMRWKRSFIMLKM